MTRKKGAPKPPGRDISDVLAEYNATHGITSSGMGSQSTVDSSSVIRSNGQPFNRFTSARDRKAATARAATKQNLGKKKGKGGNAVRK